MWHFNHFFVNVAILKATLTPKLISMSCNSIWICHLDSTSGTETCTWEMGFGINMDESYIIKLKHVFTRLLDFMK